MVNGIHLKKAKLASIHLTYDYSIIMYNNTYIYIAQYPVNTACSFFLITCLLSNSTIYFH